MSMSTSVLAVSDCTPCMRNVCVVRCLCVATRHRGMARLGLAGALQFQKCLLPPPKVLAFPKIGLGESYADHSQIPPDPISPHYMVVKQLII